MPRTISRMFAAAEAEADTITGLRDLIAAFPAELRRHMVFVALLLAERGPDELTRRGTPRKRRASRHPRGKTYDVIVDVLAHNPGIRIAALAAKVFGVDDAANQARIRTALSVMKGDRVERVPGEVGLWRPLARPAPRAKVRSKAQRRSRPEPPPPATARSGEDGSSPAVS